MVVFTVCSGRGSKTWSTFEAQTRSNGGGVHVSSYHVQWDVDDEEPWSSGVVGSGVRSQ